MKKLNEIITKAIMDEDFRKEFLTNPVKASEGFGLSDEEIAELQNVDLSELEQVNAELEERLSKSFINLPELGEDEAADHRSYSTHGSASYGDW